MDKQFIDMLCCPETHKDVSLATEHLIANINDKIKSGIITNRGGDTIKDPIDGGLIRSDKKLLYPIREDIPIMLIDEAILLEGIA